MKVWWKKICPWGAVRQKEHVRIVFVDDNPGIVTMPMILRQHGYDVTGLAASSRGARYSSRSQEVGNFSLRDSVGAGVSGMFAVNATEVMISSNRVDEGFGFSIIAPPPPPCGANVGKRAAFSKADSSPSFAPLLRAANSAGVRSDGAECGR